MSGAGYKVRLGDRQVSAGLIACTCICRQDTDGPQKSVWQGVSTGRSRRAAGVELYQDEVAAAESSSGPCGALMSIGVLEEAGERKDRATFQPRVKVFISCMSGRAFTACLGSCRAAVTNAVCRGNLSWLQGECC